MSQREEYIDIAKAIGIILVVIGHTKFNYSQFIYQFHLPLFFFLSGLVFNEKKLNDPGRFILSKIKGLYLPFIKFELLFLIFHNIFVRLNFISELSGTVLHYEFPYIVKMALKMITMGAGEQLAGPLWFLISSLEIVIIFAILIKITSLFGEYRNLLLTIICIILYYVGCYVDIPRMMSQSFIGMLFFNFGYLYKSYKSKITINKRGFFISVITIFVCSLLNQVDISQLKITYKVLLIISGVAGSYAVIYLAKQIVKRKMWLSFLSYCGKNTIYVLALHCLSFKLIMVLEMVIYRFDQKYLGYFPTYEINNWWFIILSIAGVCIPLLLKKIIDGLKEKVKGKIRIW